MDDNEIQRLLSGDAILDDFFAAEKDTSILAHYLDRAKASLLDNGSLKPMIILVGDTGSCYAEDIGFLGLPNEHIREIIRQHKDSILSAIGKFERVILISVGNIVEEYSDGNMVHRDDILGGVETTVNMESRMLAYKVITTNGRPTDFLSMHFNKKDGETIPDEPILIVINELK